MICSQNWMAQDLGIIALFENAAKGISPFAIFDLTNEDIAIMGSEAYDLERAAVVTTSDKRAHKKIKAVVPKDGHALLTTLKTYANLLFALFTSESPLFKEMVAKLFKSFKKITSA